MERTAQTTINESLTIEQRIDRINQTTDQVKRGFFVIAEEMIAIKDEMDRKGNSQKEFLKLMEDRTGYRKSSVYRFLRAHEAVGNIKRHCAQLGTFYEDESTIRPLATKALNKAPELQAEIWTDVVQQAADGRITADMVRDAVKARMKKPGDASLNKESKGLASSETHLETELAELDLLRAEVKLLKSELDEHEEIERQLKSKLASVQSECDDLKAEYERLQKEFKQIRIENLRIRENESFNSGGGIQYPVTENQAIVFRGFTNVEAEVLTEMLRFGHRHSIKKFHPVTYGSEEKIKIFNYLRNLLRADAFSNSTPKSGLEPQLCGIFLKD